ncbi:MAG TPA: outer membrane beta-barrel protein [Vicinamibacteria bacterium]|nr:outer membrane beta-barrel protein [Vicinamibacteria bacterium]
MAMVAAAPSARAADPPSSIGVELGYVKARQLDSTLVFGGDFRFGVASHLCLAPEFSYWKKSESSIAITSSVEDLQFGVNLVAVLPLGRRLGWFGGGGGGLHHVTGDLGVTGSTVVSDSTTKGGVDVLTGLEISAGDNLSFVLSGRYDWVLGLGGSDATRLDQYKFLGGFRVRF